MKDKNCYIKWHICLIVKHYVAKAIPNSKQQYYGGSTKAKSHVSFGKVN